jgi:hypothetical protein
MNPLCGHLKLTGAVRSNTRYGQKRPYRYTPIFGKVDIDQPHSRISLMEPKRISGRPRQKAKMVADAVRVEQVSAAKFPANREKNSEIFNF